jgi:hypothetical protein
MDSQSKTLLERKLALFRPLPTCLKLSQRLFQKAPVLNEQLRDHLEGAKSSHKLWSAQRFLFQRISGAVDGSEQYGLPSKLENFLSFLDLAWIVLNVDESNKVQWSTFVLQDFDVRLQQLVVDAPSEILYFLQFASNAALPLSRLRRRLKQFLPDTHLASVQIEVDEAATPGDGCELPSTRVFFRVAIIPKSRTGKNDERNLLKKPATYLVYYLNKPYFFSDKAHPDPLICQALCSSLNSASYVDIPLSGPHLDSLRQLRNFRDRKRRRPSSQSRWQKEPQQHANLERDIVVAGGWNAVSKDAAASSEAVPILNKLTLLCPIAFQVINATQTPPPC